MAVQGALSYRTYPAIPAEVAQQVRPGMGFGLTAAPPATQPICFVALRIDGLASLSSLTRRKSVRLPRHLRAPGPLKSATNREMAAVVAGLEEGPMAALAAGEEDGEEADFWKSLKPGLRQQLEAPLRSLIQSFGGYETLPKRSDVLCIAFSGAARMALAAKFCMALQVNTQETNLSPSLPPSLSPSLPLSLDLTFL